MFDEVLKFWFEDAGPASWWQATPDFDHLVRARFESVLSQAALGELEHWRRSSRGRLAEIIVLDQFSRNIYRGTSKAYAQDVTALVLAQEAIALGAPADFNVVQRSFLYMPFMHSESKAIHARAELLFKELNVESNYDFELKHKAIIDRFGRYPHRNALLGRTSSDEELAFLKLPGSSF